MFIITKDKIDNGLSVGVATFSDVTLIPKNGTFTDAQKAKIKRKMPYRFRLLDGDGEVYFEGYSHDDSSFAPLDRFGAAFGCVQIDYWESGKNGGWKEL